MCTTQYLLTQKCVHSVEEVEEDDTLLFQESFADRGRYRHASLFGCGCGFVVVNVSPSPHLRANHMHSKKGVNKEICMLT